MNPKPRAVPGPGEDLQRAAALGDALGRYANNERVESVQVSALLGGESMVTLITVSGKEYRVPAALLAMMPS